jgi:hypothetical protein
MLWRLGRSTWLAWRARHSHLGADPDHTVYPAPAIARFAFSGEERCAGPPFASSAPAVNPMDKRLPPLLRSFASAVRSTPEALLLLPLIAVSAGLSTRMGTLPGQGRPVLGPVVEGIAWGLMYLGLGLAYSAGRLADRESTRLVLRRIGLSLLLALVSAYLCHQLLQGVLGSPWAWGELFYLKRLVPLVFVVFCCAALLPRETRALVGAAGAASALTPLPQLAVLLASSAILVSGADLAFEWSGDSAVQSALKLQVITQEAWNLNVLLLFSAYAFLFAVTARVPATLLLVTSFYAVWAVATLQKIRYMHSAVQPLDVVRLGEFLPFARSFFGTAALAAATGALALWIGALVVACRRKPSPMSLGRRQITGLLSLAVLLGVPGAYFVEPAPWLWRDTGNPRSPGHRLLIDLSRAVVGEDRDRQFRETARQAGLLGSFISELPAALVSAPTNYSPAAVAGILSKYCRPGIDGSRGVRHVEEARAGGVNLIVYLVESLMDPADLGFHYTSEPIPNLRALRNTHTGGYAIVPEEFGGSPSTEFETLTGMSTAFLPEGSVAYRLYLKQPIPSLPRTLKELGYATTVVRADPKYFYNHETAFGLLGFDKVAWLHESPVVERDPRTLWPSDEAIVQTVIQAAQEAHPFFVLAFASSTHSPYSHGTYRDSDLDVRDAPTQEVAGKVKEYINALRVADHAIGTMVEYFRHRPDSTIIAVLGDHLPPLPSDPLRSFLLRSSAMSKPEAAWLRRRVPLLVWANFDLPREEKELSTNALPSYLLRTMNVPRTGFFAVSDDVERRLSIVRGYAKAADGTIWSWDSLPVSERNRLADYRLLQYDLLVGKRYALRGNISQAESCNR